MLCPSPSHAFLRPLLLILHRLIMYLSILFLRLLNFLSVLPDCDVRYGAGRCAVRAGRCAGRAARRARAARFARRPRLSGRARRDGFAGGTGCYGSFWIITARRGTVCGTGGSSGTGRVCGRDGMLCSGVDHTGTASVDRYLLTRRTLQSGIWKLAIESHV